MDTLAYLAGHPATLPSIKTTWRSSHRYGMAHRCQGQGPSGGIGMGIGMGIGDPSLLILIIELNA